MMTADFIMIAGADIIQQMVLIMMDRAVTGTVMDITVQDREAVLLAAHQETAHQEELQAEALQMVFMWMMEVVQEDPQITDHRIIILPHMMTAI